MMIENNPKRSYRFNWGTKTCCEKVVTYSQDFDSLSLGSGKYTDTIGNSTEHYLVNNDGQSIVDHPNPSFVNGDTLGFRSYFIPRILMEYLNFYLIQ